MVTVTVRGNDLMYRVFCVGFCRRSYRASDGIFLVTPGFSQTMSRTNQKLCGTLGYLIISPLVVCGGDVLPHTKRLAAVRKRREIHLMPSGALGGAFRYPEKVNR